jgi:hypothetical protein
MVLERRMRPGQWSTEGFLGASERLDEVLAADRRTVSELGLSFEQLAQPLRLLVNAGSFAPIAAFVLEAGEEAQRFRAESDHWLNAARQAFGSVEWDGEQVLVGDRFLVDVRISCGFQECPWGRRCPTGSSDWRIINVRRQLELRGPDLIPHLIETHGFFEGFQSPYRVDPAALAGLLELGPSIEAAPTLAWREAPQQRRRPNRSRVEKTPSD